MPETRTLNRVPTSAFLFFIFTLNLIVMNSHRICVLEGKDFFLKPYATNCTSTCNYITLNDVKFINIHLRNKRLIQFRALSIID
ncbi:hypothetical protein VCRA2119O430_60061 [Vibrio crassostreae]|nr:hypothetical protein VCRA2119O430_60061 [Vibrio crassostreae]CAK2170484.1 hypothetical protein VCRA2113O409_70061 [Vibrio crassostreae]CAK2183475.1 hypothetical protein VCRA2118O429_80061 [Vibrio crassostreae]CAK2191870.1 hypothetical protein VCRA2113O418_80061 [Vibrio crassostreae]CAK3076811.1 hypothetical protein VCRA2121O438_90061 [Vibrio crassostreae]